MDFEAGVEFERGTVQQVGGPAYRLWRDGPRYGHDRSTTLYQLAHRLHEADVEPSVALGVVASADQRWGKRFADRGPAGRGHPAQHRHEDATQHHDWQTDGPPEARTDARASAVPAGRLRFFKARQLCETCWVYAKEAGTLHEFPSVYDSKNEAAIAGPRSVAAIPRSSTRCRCGTTSQCLKCGREIRT